MTDRPKNSVGEVGEGLSAGEQLGGTAGMAKNVYDDGNSYAHASVRFSAAVLAKAEVRANPARPRLNCASPGSKSANRL
jgi:hypothetical protein